MARRPHRTSRNQLTFWPERHGRALAQEALPPVASWVGARAHLIGIGGIGMSGIAMLLRQEGCLVSGCDAAPSEITDSLLNAGIPVAVGHSPRHIERDCDLVIISSAVRPTNPELREAQRRGIPVVKYAQSLGWLMNQRRGIAVSGSHGKTTTTSMIAYTLNQAGRDPSMLVGGIVPQLGGNARNGGQGPFVVEACEYDRSFLNLRPRVAAITNVDRDHLDYYRGMDDLVGAFGEFAARVSRDGLLVVNGDDPNAVAAARLGRAPVQTFGESPGCDWRVRGWKRKNGMTTFSLDRDGEGMGEWRLLVPGLYNIRNAMACIAVCRFFDVDLDTIRAALGAFAGAQRRFDRLGEAAGVVVLDDYGHHPTEVKVTLEAARTDFPSRRLWCVFQPHQCSRTRMLLNEFGRSFRSADRVIVPDIYSVRDTAADRARVHARDLVQAIRGNGVEAEYQPRFPQVVKRLLTDVSDGDLVMTMGAGPVDRVARSLLIELRKRE